MKKYFIIILVLISAWGFSQTHTAGTHYSTQSIKLKDITITDIITAISQSSTDEELPTAKSVYDFLQDNEFDADSIYNLIGNNRDSIAILTELLNSKMDTTLFYSIIDTLSGSSGEFDGDRPISNTKMDVYNDIPGGETVTEFLENLFYPALAPVADLSYDFTNILEMGDPNNIKTINWSATKKTNLITSIVVNGVSKTLTNGGDSESGTQQVTLSMNQTNTISMSASDGNLTGSDTYSFYYRYAYYWGSIDHNSSITDLDIRGLDGAGVGIGKELTTSRVKSFDGIDANGDYIIFAFPSAWGTPTFIVNGLTSTAFTKVRDDGFTNGFSLTTDYQVWISNSKQNSPIAAFKIQ